MPECGNCGRHVSDSYARVNADRDGVVLGCPDCNADRRDNSPVSGTLYSLRSVAQPAP